MPAASAAGWSARGADTGDRLWAVLSYLGGNLFFGGLHSYSGRIGPNRGKSWQHDEIGILTWRRRRPGLNSVIKSVVYNATEIGCEVFGIRRGWEGLTHMTPRGGAVRRRAARP